MSSSKNIKVCVAGCTGWTGTALCSGIMKDQNLSLISGVSRSSAGKMMFEKVPIYVSLQEALEKGPKPDVLVDYTHPSVVKKHAILALQNKIFVVIGTSGLVAQDFKDLEKVALENGVGVIASGNFSITASLMKQFSLWAAKYIKEFELIDYASATKPDVPSGTIQELAECLGDVQKPQLQVPIDKLHGPKETRGAEINGVRVHSVRLPGYTLSCEAIFGMQDEKLTIRHDAGSGAQPYVAGTILAIKKVQNVKGIVRGLNTLLFE